MCLHFNMMMQSRQCSRQKSLNTSIQIEGHKTVSNIVITRQCANSLIEGHRDGEVKPLKHRSLFSTMYSWIREQSAYARTNQQSERKSERGAVILVKHYLEWIESKGKNTNNKVHKMILNDMMIMNIYKNMVMAVQNRDSIMIERTYIVLLRMFEGTGKKNYVEIVCGMVKLRRRSDS